MGSKLAWLVVILGLIIAWGSVRGTLLSSLQTYVSGGRVDVVGHITSPFAQQLANQPSGNPTVILTERAGSQPPAGTNAGTPPTGVIL